MWKEKPANYQILSNTSIASNYRYSCPCRTSPNKPGSTITTMQTVEERKRKNVLNFIAGVQYVSYMLCSMQVIYSSVGCICVYLPTYLCCLCIHDFKMKRKEIRVSESITVYLKACNNIKLK